MLGFGGDLMLWKKFGVGADVNFQPAKQTYVNLNASAALNGAEYPLPAVPHDTV